jgi:hypothetical protein
VRTRSSRLRVCGAVAAPVLVAAFGWTPAAHAAGPGASLPTVPPVSVAPAVAVVHAVRQTVAGAASTVGARRSPVVATARDVVKRATTAVIGASTTASPHTASAPKTGAGATERADRAQPRHRAAQAASGAPQLARGSGPGVAVQLAAAGPSAQVAHELPGLQPPSGLFSGVTMGGGSGFALLFVALAAAFSGLAAPGLGRRLMPSIADGRDRALTLDLERPD